MIWKYIMDRIANFLLATLSIFTVIKEDTLQMHKVWLTGIFHLYPVR